MFKFLKDKLKQAVSKFTKDVEEEAEDVEEKVEVTKEVKEKPKPAPKPKPKPAPKPAEPKPKEEKKKLQDAKQPEGLLKTKSEGLQPKAEKLPKAEREEKPESEPEEEKEAELSIELQGLKEGLDDYSVDDLDSLMSILGFPADVKGKSKEEKVKLVLKKPLVDITSAMDKLEGVTEEPEEKEIEEEPEEKEEAQEEEKEEELIEEVEEEEKKLEEPEPEEKEEEKPKKKKGFFGRLFGKKEEEEEPEEEVEEKEPEPPTPPEEEIEEKEEPEFKIPPPEEAVTEEETQKEEEPEEKKQDIDEELREVDEEKEEEEKEVEEEDRELEEEKDEEPEDEEEEKPKGFFGRLTQSITLKKLSESKFEEIFFDIELALLENNVAVEVIEKIKKDLKDEMVDQKLKRSQIESIVLKTLKGSLDEILSVEKIDLLKKVKSKGSKPYIIVFVGINGSGKTTTIAKMAKYFMNNNMKPVLVAGDTFRAAAIQQLEEHAKNLNLKIIKHDYGSDPAAVAFDGIKYAESKGLDVVLIDTAGRLHSNTNLMDEMKKIIRVAKPDMKIFIGESITGNDCVEQAQKFNDAIEIDGIVLSKADVDEKGGAAISVSYVTGKPILFLGTGQTYDSLESFNKKTILSNLGLA